MLQECQDDAEQMLFDFPLLDGKTIELRKREICQQYTEFWIAALKDRTNNSFCFKMLVEGHCLVMQYWQCDAGRWPILQDIALRVFSMSTSAAASERNFSVTGFVHNKGRN